MIGGSAGPLALPRQCLKPDPWAGYCLSLRRSSSRPEGAAAEGLRVFPVANSIFLLTKDRKRNLAAHCVRYERPHRFAKL